MLNKCTLLLRKENDLNMEIKNWIIILGILIFSTTNSDLKAQKIDQLDGKLIKVFNPNLDADPYQFAITNIEAPFPGGDGYRDGLLEWKEKLEKIYPRNKTKLPNSQRSSQPTPQPIKKIIPQQGFSSKSPIPGGTPSDNTLAVSDDGFLITSWNTEIYAYDLNADTAMYLPGAFRPAITFSSFSPLPTNSPFDPKLLYNPKENKFVLVFLSGRTPTDSKIMVAFSTTSNPTDPWNVYELDGAPINSTTWTDYPAIAMNDNELFLTINLVIINQPWETGFDRTLIWQMDLEAGFNGDATLPSNLISEVKYNNRYLRYLCPVQNGEGPSGDKMHFISNRNYPQLSDSIVLTNDSVFLVTVSGDMNSNPTVDVKHITSPIPYITPPRANQPNGHIFETNDGRVLGGILMDETIQFVASTRDVNSGYPILMHGFIDNISSANPTMKANLINHEYLELGYPNITCVGTGSNLQDVVIGFNHTADTVFSGYSVVYYNGTSNEYSDILQIKKGEGYVDMHAGTSSERWGDYFGIQRKYNEPGKVFTCGYWGQANNKNAMSVDELITQNYIFPSVSEIKENKISANVYPNPTIESNPILNVDFKLDDSQYVKIYINDVNGKTHKTFLNDFVKKGENRIQLSTENLSKGSYLLVIEPINGEKLVKPIVKL